MPWSIKVYGKYYIHGEPYYSNGKKMTTINSGGCIQLLNKDAKDFFELTSENTPILIIDKKNENYNYQKPKTPFPKINSSSYLVADIGSGHIFAFKNVDTPLPIASITKMMTAIVLVENVDLRKSVQFTQKTIQAHGSINDFEVGERFGVVEILYPLLVSSSDDAAEAISWFLGKTKTIQLMNEKAQSIMMGKTKFVDVSGVSEDNISTAKDLFYLARYVFNNRIPLFKITKGERVSFSKGAEQKWKTNKNLFFKNQNFIGGKTGYIKESDYAGLFLFQFFNEKKEARNIVIIILGAKNLNNTSEDGLEFMVQRTIEWLNENYFSQKNE